MPRIEVRAGVYIIPLATIVYLIPLRCGHSSPSSPSSWSSSPSGSMSNTSNIAPAPSNTHATRRPTRPFTASVAAPRLHPTSSRECAIGRGTAEICDRGRQRGTIIGGGGDANVPRLRLDPARRVRRYPRARRRRRAENPRTPDRRSAPSRRTPGLQASYQHRVIVAVTPSPSAHPPILISPPTHNENPKLKTLCASARS